MCRLLLLLLLLLVFTKAMMPPSLKVVGHTVKEDPKIGFYVELNENETLVLSCCGEKEKVEFALPDKSGRVGYESSSFEKRVNEEYDRYLLYRTLAISRVSQSDTGSYTCFSTDHPTSNRSVHVFVKGTAPFVEEINNYLLVAEGEIEIPCKSNRFVNTSEITLMKHSSHQSVIMKEEYDQRTGFRIRMVVNKKTNYERAHFECLDKSNPSRKADYRVTVRHPKMDDDEDFDFYWKKSTDWPHANLQSYSMECRLDYKGNGSFEPWSNQLFIHCEKCTEQQKKRAKANVTFSIDHVTAEIRFEVLQQADSGIYRCSWSRFERAPRQLFSVLKVAPNDGTVIRINERSPRLIVVDEGASLGEGASLSADFAVFPLTNTSVIAEWSREFANSSVPTGVQRELVEGGVLKRKSNETFDGVVSAQLAIGTNASTASETYILRIQYREAVELVRWNVVVGKEFLPIKPETVDADRSHQLEKMVWIVFVVLVVILVVGSIVHFYRKVMMNRRRFQRQSAGQPSVDTAHFGLEMQPLPTLKKTCEVKSCNLEVFETLGSGQFGVVVKGRLQLAGAQIPVAVKRQRRNSDAAQTTMLREELQIMEGIGKHPNVLALIGVVTTRLSLILEFAELGSMRDFLLKFQEDFEDVQDDGEYLTPRSKEMRSLMKKSQEASAAAGQSICIVDLISFSMQIANGMKYLASLSCVHRDLAARNILLTGQKIVRIADFGLARRYSDSPYYLCCKTADVPVPIRWMSLEALLTNKFTEKSDVWSFGICMYEIFTLGSKPYHLMRNEEVIENLKTGYRLAKPNLCPDEVYALMKECWEEAPCDRPPFSKCMTRLKIYLKIVSPKTVDKVNAILEVDHAQQKELEDMVRAEVSD